MKGASVTGAGKHKHEKEGSVSALRKLGRAACLSEFLLIFPNGSGIHRSIDVRSPVVTD